MILKENVKYTLLDLIDTCRTFGTFSALGIHTETYTTVFSSSKIEIEDQDEQCTKDINLIVDKLREVNDLQNEFAEKYGQRLNIFG